MNGRPRNSLSGIFSVRQILLFSYYIWRQKERGKEASIYCALATAQALWCWEVLYASGIDLSCEKVLPTWQPYNV